jgi:sensitive to high expression protein 9
VSLEEKIKLTREAAKQAKLAYEQAAIQRSNSQHEINELLQRKSLWNETDVVRFTTIVRQDHLFEQEEARAKAAVDETEAAVEREFTSLMRSILARYHEEQVWSDKIRSASTYGSLAVLGLNLIVFILAIVIVEPWKRRRLAQTFEKKIEEMDAENKIRMEVGLKSIGEKFVQQENLLAQVLEDFRGVLELKNVMVDVQRAADKEALIPPIRVVEPPVPLQKSVSLPGIPVTLPQRTFELAAVGVGAFVLGILASVLLD